MTKTGWHHRSPLAKLMRGEPGQEQFEAMLPLDVEFTPLHRLEPIRRVSWAMDELRQRDERAWQALALFMILPAPLATDRDRAGSMAVDLPTYRRLVREGLQVILPKLAGID